MKMKKLIGVALLAFLLAGCKDKSDSMSNEQKIAGNDQKTWIATRETNSEGDKDKLTRDEKKESITFWSNGNVKMANGEEAQSGQWSYSGNTLTLQFTGAANSENFTVVDLDDDEMKLKAADGSQMTLKPD
jgi:hypothetical protein